MLSKTDQTVSKIYLSKDGSLVTIVDLDIRYSIDAMNKNHEAMSLLVETIFDKFEDVHEVQIVFQNDYTLFPLDRRNRKIEDEIWTVDEFSDYQRFDKEDFDGLRRFNAVSTCGLSHEIFERDKFLK